MSTGGEYPDRARVSHFVCRADHPWLVCSMAYVQRGLCADGLVCKACVQQGLCTARPVLDSRGIYSLTRLDSYAAMTDHMTP